MSWLDSDSTHPVAPSAHGSIWLGGEHVFHAHTQAGEVRLHVPMERTKQPVDAVEAALALARCEPLLREMEEWLGTTLDMAPLPASQATAVPPGLSAEVVDAELAPAGASCLVSWSVLKGAPAPRRLMAPRLSWRSMVMLVELARFAVAPADAAELRHGSLLLLPESFGPEWPVRLIEARDGGVLECTWHIGAAPRLRMAKPLGFPGTAETAEWLVVACEPVCVSGEAALGWADGPCEIRDPAVERGERHVPLPAKLLLADSGQAIAVGVIVAALQGAALWVREPIAAASCPL